MTEFQQLFLQVYAKPNRPTVRAAYDAASRVIRTNGGTPPSMRRVRRWLREDAPLATRASIDEMRVPA